MTDHNNYPQELLDLIASKEFLLLTEAEKALVFRYMDAAEYEALRFTWTAVGMAEKSAAQMVMPAKKTTDAIFQRFKEKQRPSPVVSLMQSRIPVWQAAAVLLLAIGMTFALSPRKELVVINEGLANADTVYVEKPVEKTQYIWDTVYIARASEQKSLPTKADEMAPPAPERQPSTFNEPSAHGLSILRMDQARQMPSGGKSLGDDSMASNFKYVTL